MAWIRFGFNKVFHTFLGCIVSFVWMI